MLKQICNYLWKFTRPSGVDIDNASSSHGHVGVGLVSLVENDWDYQGQGVYCEPRNKCCNHQPFGTICTKVQLDSVFFFIIIWSFLILIMGIISNQRKENFTAPQSHEQRINFQKAPCPCNNVYIHTYTYTFQFKLRL